MSKLDYLDHLFFPLNKTLNGLKIEEKSQQLTMSLIGTFLNFYHVVRENIYYNDNTNVFYGHMPIKSHPFNLDRKSVV